MSRLYEELYLGKFPDPPRCENKGITTQCPDQAQFIIEKAGLPEGRVCHRCLTAVIWTWTSNGYPVTIHRIGGYRNASSDRTVSSSEESGGGT